MFFLNYLFNIDIYDFFQVKFPVRPSGAGAALSGKETIFEVEVNKA